MSQPDFTKVVSYGAPYEIATIKEVEMDNLIEKARKFLDVNLGYKEIELSDEKGNKVKLVRCTPAPAFTYTYPSYTTPYYGSYGPSPY